MLASSTTRRSHSSGCSSVRRNSPVRGSVSNRRWMVFASSPVLSDNRLAARPVGAQSATRTCLAIRIFRIELTSVVLPTPGPPVITSTLLERAVRTASRWLAASCRPVRRSTHGIALAASIGGQGGPADSENPQSFGDGLLGPVQAREEHAATAFQQVGHDIAGLQLQRQRRRDQVVGNIQQPARSSAVSSSTGRPQCPSFIASASA